MSYGDIDMIFIVLFKIWKLEIIVENLLVFICSFVKFLWIFFWRMFENVFVCFYIVFMCFFYCMRLFYFFYFLSNCMIIIGCVKVFIIFNL